MVLDNAADLNQVRPLLPGSAGCAVVITSRIQLSGLVASAGARPFILDLPTEAEAREMLASRLGYERVTAESAATPGAAYERALAMTIELGDRYAEAAVRGHLGDLSYATGDVDGACRA
ncbi:MAG TPA: hypothetical protein VFQ44_12650 [Streptosporangiaceae bacterium]|nr:hypothetical protein [Streptosporangiaceae bacterium]